MQYIRIETSLLSVCVTEVLTIINRSRPENYRILLTISVTLTCLSRSMENEAFCQWWIKT